MTNDKKWKIFLTFLFLFGVICWKFVDATKESNTDNGKTARKSRKRPVIVAIIADDCGWNDVGFHGSNQIPTPNIDALGYNGIIFQRHYVMPVCTPSRTALLTGKYPIRMGMEGEPLVPSEPRGIPLNVTLLPSYLKNLGYATHMVGKWHVGYYTERHTPTWRGFDTFYGAYNGHIQYFNHTIRFMNHTGYDLHRNERIHQSVEYTQKYITDLLTDEAERIIDGHNQSRPLFLEIAHTAVHASDASNPIEVRDEREMNATLGYIKDLGRRRYASMVTALDESVGRIVKALKRTGMLENSIILFLSDNGAPTVNGSQYPNHGSNYPLRGIKNTLYEGGIRGAACMYSPLIKAPSRVSHELIHISDWLPTFYSAAGGNVNDLNSLDGVDQWPSIKYGTAGKRSSVLFNINEMKNESSALVGRYKLVKGKGQFYGYYGDSGISDSYPAYNLSKVLSSDVAKAIASVSKKILSKAKVTAMRKMSKVICKNTTSYSMCTDQCLFDILVDPCETTDLSAKYPNIAMELNAFIDDYKRVLVRQPDRIVDPAGFPENFGGVWMPWRSDA